MSFPSIHSTTILCVRRDAHVALGGRDGQVTIGDTVMKASANKVRTLKGGKILAGFAGAAADAFTLFEKFEEKLERYPGNLPRAAVELAKDWRSDRVLRRLEALLVVADREHGYVISGSGELIEPDDGILAIGSGGSYALAAARAMLKASALPAKEIVQGSLEIAAEICAPPTPISPCWSCNGRPHRHAGRAAPGTAPREEEQMPWLEGAPSQEDVAASTVTSSARSREEGRRDRHWQPLARAGS